jgi:hypothetical protein
VCSTGPATLQKLGDLVRAGLVLAATVMVVLLGLAGCGLTEQSAQSPRGPAADDSAAIAKHVHRLGVDPADGTVYVATHGGLFHLGSVGGLQPADTTGRVLMGFTVTGPRRFLSSGHPGSAERAPNLLGVVESRDAGATWTTLGLQGRVDFHALAASSAVVYGLDAASGQLMVSQDSGQSWQARGALAAVDIAVNPSDPAVVLATVQGGVAVSRDGGRTFSGTSGPQLALLSWVPSGTFYGLTPDGGLFTSTDAATTWQRVGAVPGGGAQALTAVDQARVLAATTAGIFESRDGGHTFNPLK